MEEYFWSENDKVGLVEDNRIILPEMDNLPPCKLALWAKETTMIMHRSKFAVATIAKVMYLWKRR